MPSMQDCKKILLSTTVTLVAKFNMEELAWVKSNRAGTREPLGSLMTGGKQVFQACVAGKTGPVDEIGMCGKTDHQLVEQMGSGVKSKFPHLIYMRC